ncbi:DNA/RNA non-specific endonuclease [Bullifex porci]|uniref:DNA/RNA non-specific endonuclease n=1 Tax=Bullifex porci TaxID=2606638 RepID=UPI0023F3E3F7|nr:DNA/RNA non-specific endonuclease [Bullifex porci]MDD7254414.1 DNA/RNA non-specific endonuclease [Bullifex porci]
MRKFLIVFLVFTLLFQTLSCSGTTKTPADVKNDETSAVIPNNKPDSNTKEDEEENTPTDTNKYIISGQSDLLEIRNDNVPYFTAADYGKARSGYFMELSPLDELGRVGSNWGCFDYAHMPTEERTSLSTKPTGWVQKSYEIVSGRYLYNRSHIIGFQICGLNDEKRNLMTGTRAFNAGENSMLTFENMTADHMRENRTHHVLYRVTPDFEGSNLLAYGVLIESDCLECDDNADYCVYILNQQDGITIDYRTGDNWLTGENEDITGDWTYILNTGTKKFHLLTCSGAPSPSSKNYQLTDKTKSQVIDEGYSPCGICKP